MTYEIVVGALALIGALIVVLKPIINLNTNITALKSSVDQLKDILTDLKERVTNHGREIDEIRDVLGDHEARIRVLEKSEEGTHGRSSN